MGPAEVLITALLQPVGTPLYFHLYDFIVFHPSLSLLYPPKTRTHPEGAGSSM